MVKSLNIDSVQVDSLPTQVQLSRTLGFINTTGYTVSIAHRDGHVDVVPSGMGSNDVSDTFIVTRTVNINRETVNNAIKSDEVPFETKVLYKQVLEAKRGYGSNSFIVKFEIATEDLNNNRGVYLKELDLLIYLSKKSNPPPHPALEDGVNDLGIIESKVLTLSLLNVGEESEEEKYINVLGKTLPVGIVKPVSCTEGTYIAHSSMGEISRSRFSEEDAIVLHDTESKAKSVESYDEHRLNMLLKENADLRKENEKLTEEVVRIKGELTSFKDGFHNLKDFIGQAISIRDRENDHVKKSIESANKMSEITTKTRQERLTTNSKLISDSLKLGPMVKTALDL